MPSASQRKGACKEELAERHLSRHGYEIIDRNWRGGGGEIDRIAWEEGTLVFIEIRSRKSGHHGEPAETVSPKKQAHLVRAASVYLQGLPTIEPPPIRFDVVSVLGRSIKIIQDAFQVEENTTRSSVWMV